MKLKYLLFLTFLLAFSFSPTFAQTFEITDMASLTAALNTAQTLPNETHILNINGNLQLTSAITEALNLEFKGTNSTTPYNLDLNGLAMTFTGTDKTVTISNLNITTDTSTGGIIGRNKLLIVENSTLTGHTRWGCELIRNTSGALTVSNSKLLNNNSDFGAAIDFWGTNASVKNSEISGNNASFGGGIYAHDGILDITGSKFNNNTSSAGGGAILINQDSTTTIDSTNFTSNSVTGGSTGGAIFNQGTLTIKNGSTFKNNEVLLGSGGAISNRGTLKIDSTTFESNIAKQDGGAIADTGSSTITNSTFKNNQSLEYLGGAIASTKDLKIENCNFDQNSAYTFGGAIAVMQGTATITSSKFTNNTAQSSFGGGAIINYLSTLDLEGSNLFQDNYSKAKGGAITATTNSVTNISSGTQFIGNKADDLGGGIFSQGTINLNADNSENPIIFRNNQDKNGTNAIHLDIYTNQPVGIGTLNVNLSNGGKVLFEDNISGVENTVVNINGTSSYNDKVYFGSANENLNSTVNLKDVSLEFYNGISAMPNAVLNAENTHFNFMNGVITQNKLNLNLIGNDNSFSIDVDPANATSDYFILTNSSRSALQNITLRDINLLSEPTQPLTIFDLFNHNIYGTNLTLSEKLKNQTVYGAVKKYYWALTPKLTLIEAINEFNPNIQRYQGATASAFMNQMLSYDYSLNRTDEIYTNLREGKIVQQKLNSYAFANRSGMYVDQYYQDGSAFWIRPYVNLESFHLSGAISHVRNQSYGMMIGFDFPMHTLKNDWKLFSTIYGAYIGSSQQFEASNMCQNGGYGGYLLSLFKNNFYTGWTINGGGVGVENHYLGQKDDYAIVTAGTALKLAYNLKFKRLIFQPNFTTSYTFLNPTNLVNFQNVDLSQSQVNGLMIAPSLRITYRNENGFEPYLFGGCVIPIMSDIKLKADDTHLDKLKLNTWAQFGAGVRKRITERVTCFAESIIRVGGRVGWGFMFNLQISI